MGLYGEKKDYEELVKENIEHAKLLHSLSDEDKKIIVNLINQKELIKSKNGLFANFKLKRIYKKIEKIQKKYKS